MFEELFELTIDGAFASKDEFNAFTKEASNEEIFSVLKEGAFTDFNEFNSLYSLKKKDESQPTSQEDVTESITKEEPTPTSLESSEKYYLQNDLDSLKTIEPETSSFETPMMMMARGVSRSKRDLNTDLKEKVLSDFNIQKALENDIITENQIDGALKGAKSDVEKLEQLAVKPQEEYIKLINEKNLDRPYAYEDKSTISYDVSDQLKRLEAIQTVQSFEAETKALIDANPNATEEELQAIYNRDGAPTEEQYELADKDFIPKDIEESDISNMYNVQELNNIKGFNIKDFDGYLNEQGYKEEYLRLLENETIAEDNRDFDYSGFYNPSLAAERLKLQFLTNYINSQIQRSVEYQVLDYQSKNEGKHPSFDGAQVSFSSGLDDTSLSNFIEKEFPLITTKLKERDVKNQELYKDLKKYDVRGSWRRAAGQAFKQGWRSLEDRINSFSAGTYDFIGMDSMADEIRMNQAEIELDREDFMVYTFASGKEKEIDGITYLVDDKGQVYDKNINRRVTDVISPNELEYIRKEVDEKGEKSSTFSTEGMIIQGSGIATDMLVQIALTKGVGNVGTGIGGALSLTSKGKRAIDFMSKIPMKGTTASAMVAQGTLFGTSLSEETYKNALDNGLSIDQANEVRSIAGSQGFALGALTAPLSTQSYAMDKIFGKNANNVLVKGALEAYEKGGVKGARAYWTKALIKAEKYVKEGGKEVFQENVQTGAQAYVIGENVNEIAKKEIMANTVSGDEFINTSILSFAAGFFMPFAGDISSNVKTNIKKRYTPGLSAIDKINSLKILSKNVDKTKALLENQVTRKLYTQEQVDKILEDIKIFKETINNIPPNLSADTALTVMRDIAEIRKQEELKRQLDPAFHEDVDNKIKELREDIIKKTKFDYLSNKAKLKLKDDAIKELSKEAEERGEKDFVIDDSQATFRAIENFSKLTKTEQDAIQEQETRDIPDAERAEGVQEMEEEVREPAVEETEEIEYDIQGLDFKPTKPELKADIENAVDELFQDDEKPNIVDIYVTGSRTRGEAKDVSDLDIVVEYEGDLREDDFFNAINEEPLTIGGITIDINPIKKEKTGDISEFKAKEQEFLKTKQTTKTDTEQAVAEEESIKSPEVIVEDAPDGTFLNIEMVAGKDGREMTQKEILDALPVDPLNVEVSDKTLIIQVPRELSGTEMMKLAKDTEQDAIPQLSGKKGVLHAQSQEQMEKYEGQFVPSLFIKPQNIIKDEKPKAGNRLFNEPLKAVKEIANRYYERVFGKERPKFEGTRKLDKEFAKRISDAFENMQNNPNDPNVKASYEAMAKETMDQYQDFIDAGYTVEINNEEPYANSQEMIDDLRKNKRIKIFSTESGFGDTAITDKQRNDNPLLRYSGVKDINGQTMLINDVFRAIHDFYGHAELGNSFGPKGEENAWQVHARMFSPLARRAMTTETRGQNSYVNFSGVNKKVDALREKARKLREQGKDAQNVVDEIYKLTRFADQKVGLLPEEFSNIDGIEETKEVETLDTDQVVTEGPKRKTIENELESFANRVIEEGIDSFSDEALQFYAENKEALDKIIEEKQKQKPKTDSKSRSLALKIVEGKKDFSDAEIDLFAANEDKIRAEVDSIANTRGIQITSDNYKDIIKSTKRPRKKVTVNEYTALKDQIRLEARAARDAQRDLNLKRKDIAAMIKDLSSKGKITANQSKVLINRVSSVNLNNDQSVEKLIKYMDKVYKNAEYADNILRSNKKRENAKKNIRTKIGSANVVFNTLNKLFSIDAKLIPQDVLDTYNDIVNQFGESRAVLKLEDVSVINEKANSILEAIDKEVSEIPKLQLLFEGLDKVIIKGKEDFAATIAQALSNEEITREDFDLMKKYKKDIIPPVEKTKSDTEPFAFEFKKNNVEDSMENKGASRLIELLKNKKAVDQLSDGIKKNIQSVIDNIDSGFFPSYANNIANEIESIIAKDKVVPRIKKGRYVIDRAVAKIKNFFASNRSTLEYQIRQNPLSDIDNVLGNMNRTDIYDNIFGKAAKSYATLDAEIDTVHEKILKADALLLNQFKNNGNKVTESKYRIMAYMLEREFQSNKDNNKVFSASEAIKAAIDSQKKGKTTIYSKRDIKILESILKDFDGDVNIKNVFDKFSKREKKAIAIIDEVNKSIADKALYTASVIRGARPNMIDNYVHHSVASSNENTVESITSKYNQFKTFSTKAGTLIERTPGVKALDFDVLKSTLKGAKETLTDYHMTDTARVIFKTLNKIQADIIADKNSTDRQIETANALISAFDTAMRQVFEMNYVNNGMNLLSRIKGLGYKALLASVPRAAAELGSNFSYVILTSPKAFAIGSKYREYVLDQRGRDIMMNLNSEQTGKLYSKKVTGKTADIGLFVDSEGASPTGAVNELQNRANQILSYSSKVTTKPTEKIAEALISTPDKAISRPLWFGSLDTKFKELTGKKIDMEAIRNQDSKYLRDNKEALDKATRFADKEVTRAATSINVFNGVLKNKIDPNDSTTLKTIKEINGFMTNFMIYEYTTARSAISAIINSGEISRQKGASLLLGTLTRMSLYMVLYQLFSHTFDSVVAAVTGADIGDEEPPEEDLLLRQLVGSIFSMIVGKNLGNFAKILPNMSLEAINEKYLENLRKGDEYDPYKHSISFSMLSREDLKDIETGRSGIGDVLLKSFSGPYSPIIKTLSRSAILLSKIKSEKSKDSTKERAKDELTKRIILEMMGNMGMIPFYKDVRRIVIKDFFKEQKEEKSNLRVNLRSNNIIIRK